ncbi:hypothetical protein [Nocardioides sp. NPDC006273]|uniref:hypothetical protein n=1 Tax=Nocardioides sp. NPDC006273 TaxID=3155598 RepID=UPI0033A60BEF
MSTSSTNIPLGGESCPKCKSTDAWHGVIVEPGEDERYACDECGHWMAITITRTKQPEPPKAKRPFGFTFEIDKGRLFIDWRGEHLLAFRPGRYLSIGDNWELLSSAEAEWREEQATDVGREVGRREAEEEMAS